MENWNYAYEADKYAPIEQTFDIILLSKETNYLVTKISIIIYSN